MTTMDSEKAPLIILSDALSGRVFADCGVLKSLASHYKKELQVWARYTNAAGWKPIPGTRLLPDDLSEELKRPDSRAWWRVMAEKRFGFHPLALQFNFLHGFHLPRMERNHRNGFLNLSNHRAVSRIPAVYDMMYRWYHDPERGVRRELEEYIRTNASAVVVSNTQHRYVAEVRRICRRHNIPIVGYIASWDHTVGKGCVNPWLDLYIVQNPIMKQELIDLHHIDASRIRTTGWPQTDIFFRRRPAHDYSHLLESYGLEPDKPAVLFTGNTVTNAPYEGAFNSRVVEWWKSSGADKDFSIIFRPHPKDSEWKVRYRDALDVPGIHVQEPSYQDIETLALLLQHAGAVVTNAGTILLDSLVNGRPLVCVLFDEGAPAGEVYSQKNTVGKHYEGLMASGAFYKSEGFEEMTSQIQNCLQDPAALESERKRICEEIVMTVDGNAATRVAEAILEGVTS